MKPLSLDLRERIISALEETPSSLIVGARFGVSSSFVRKFRKKVAERGSIEPMKLPGRERIVVDEDEETLRELVKQNPDATLNMLREMLVQNGGPAISETTMWRQLNRMGITLKKKRSAPPSRTGRT